MLSKSAKVNYIGGLFLPTHYRCTPSVAATDKLLALDAEPNDNSPVFWDCLSEVASMTLEFEEGPKPELRRSEMADNQEKQNNLIDTTDCLEAVGVFRGWKNFFFIITILCLLLLQVCFWLVDTGYVKAEGQTQILSPPVATEESTPVAASVGTSVVDPNALKIEKAAKQVITEPNKHSQMAPQKKGGTFFNNVKAEHMAWLIRFLDFVLVIVAVLYCLTMLFALKVSLLGRIGGINHISRAFFLSLIMLVFLLPWQKLFAGVVVGAIFTPRELFTSCTANSHAGMLSAAIHYLRFTGLWLLVLLLLIFSQVRSARWAKATLRRLEVI